MTPVIGRGDRTLRILISRSQGSYKMYQQPTATSTRVPTADKASTDALELAVKVTLAVGAAAGVLTVVLRVVTKVRVEWTVVVLEMVWVVDIVVVMLPQKSEAVSLYAEPVTFPQAGATLAVTTGGSLITSSRATARAICAKTRGGWITRAAPVAVVVLAAAVAVMMVVLDAAW